MRGGVRKVTRIRIAMVTVCAAVVTAGGPDIKSLSGEWTTGEDVPVADFIDRVMPKDEDTAMTFTMEIAAKRPGMRRDIGWVSSTSLSTATRLRRCATQSTRSSCRLATMPPST